jgi:F-type H+-transporting ATPase subunit gamma
MANLKEVRDRIQSVISTQQITKAMKLVSASKLRRSQQAIQQLRPYSQKLNEMLSNIVATVSEDDMDSAYSVDRENKKNVCIVVITSNRGLCGAYNSNVNKAALTAVSEKYSTQYEAGNLTLLFIGKKGKDSLTKRLPKAKFITDYVDLVGKEFSSQDSIPVAERLMEAFTNEEFDALDIAYARFRNAAMQEYEVEQFLPIAKAEVKEGSFSHDFIFEPEKSEFLSYLIPAVLKTQFHKTILDSNASENGARMTAMDKATDNAEDMLRDLRINYNKARQEAITTELGEIVGGAAALEGS